MDSKRKSNQHTTERDNAGATRNQLPEWHPFAVWQNEIRSQQTSQTGQHRIISPTEIAEA